MQLGESSIFYNPHMSMNRDIAILFADSFFAEKIRVCDPMTASGVRAVRYLLECTNVEAVEALDVDPASVEYAHRVLLLNHVNDEAGVVVAEANHFLIAHKNRFNLVDLDPFGCPVRFYENALRSVVHGGVLAVTATDMALLTGARHAACLRKYNVAPVRADFAKESAVRILGASIALAAHRLGLGVRVVFSHVSDHYSRVYVDVRMGKKAANQSAKALGFVEYCPACLRRVWCYRFEDFQHSCHNCGGSTLIGGPMWLGALWDADLVRRMSGRSGFISSSRLSELQKLLGLVEEEMDGMPFYFRVDEAARGLGKNPPKIASLLCALRASGYAASRTHFHPNGVRTDAPVDTLRSEVCRLADEAKSEKV